MQRCIILLLFLFLSRPIVSLASPVKTGDEVLSETGFAPLKGKRFALVTNQSARVGDLHVLDLMARSGVSPAVIFTPEHGLDGTAEDGVKLEDGSYRGVPVKSLYGTTRKPAPQDLGGLDLVVFDIQDAGVRFYTYIATMGLVMQAAAETHLPVLVLDRPNPLGGEYVSGFVRRTLPASFTSPYPIPVAYGMTAGELAEMIKGEHWLTGLEQLELEVVPMQGWQRWMRWPDTGLPWVATSPNLASFDSALLYPGIGLLEGTSASAGRGTDEPFQLAGWPGVDPDALARELNAEDLSGVHFEPARYTPVSLPGRSSSPEYLNRELGGVRIEITDYRSVPPVETGAAVLCALYDALPEAERKEFFHGGIDDMSGSARMRAAVEGGESATEVESLWKDGVDRFKQLRRGYLIYPERPAAGAPPGGSPQPRAVPGREFPAPAAGQQKWAPPPAKVKVPVMAHAESAAQ